MLQKLAFLLVGLGGLVLIGWAGKDFFTSSEVPLLVRIAVGAIAAGFLVLLGIAIKDRLAKRKREDFKGVDN
jgi:drug/metabolite transporter (DMT)-like permease